MQNDLIDRKALIEKLTYCSALGRKSYEEVVKIVNEQPIAYDVEKVVEELEEEKYTREERFKYDTRTQERMVCYNKGINRAIRIIRNGGKE